MEIYNDLDLNNYDFYNVDNHPENFTSITDSSLEFDFESQKRDIISWAENNNMTYHEVNNDGGCQFYAFACAYNKILKQKNVNSDILTSLEKNQEKKNTEQIRLVILAFSENYLTGYNTDSKINQEVDSLFDINEWGNHYSLILLSNYYNVNISVYDYVDKDNIRNYTFKPKEKSTDEIKLLRINNSHYDYLT